MRARTLTRRHLRATVALAVFAGLAGGLAIGLWGMARRTASSLERFLAYEAAGNITVFGCPEGVETYEGNEDLCGQFDYEDILAALRDIPSVRSAGRLAQGIGAVAPVGEPNRWTRQLITIAVDPEAAASLGRPIVVAGREADPAVSTEVVVNEELRRYFGLDVGDPLVLTPYGTGEFDAAGEGKVPPTGVPTTVTVVGIVRHPSDLTAALGGQSLYQRDSYLQAGPAWWTAMGGDVARYGLGVGVQLMPGATNDDVTQALTDRWPGRLLGFDESGVGLAGGSRDLAAAISLQARGLVLVAVFVGLAGVVFAGQAVSRQSRREWADAGSLAAIGMTRASMARSAALRSLVIAAPALVIAGVLSVAVSPLGPIGIGRGAEVNPGLRADAVVLLVGLPLVAACVVLAAVLPVLTFRRSPATAPPVRRSRFVAHLPATATAGRAMTVSRRAGGLALGSAVAGVALAVAAGVAAASLGTSYRSLLADPVRFGASWDAIVGNVGSPEQQQATEAALRAIPGIQAAGLDNVSGGPGGPDLTFVTFKPLIGDTPLMVVTEGRPPVGPAEVALGSTTMRRLGVRIGDTVHLPPGDPAEGVDVTVVGRAVIHDGYGSAQPGAGAAVSADLYRRLAPDSQAAVYAVWVLPGTDRTATMAALRAAFPTTYTEPVAPNAVRNLGLVERQPIWLALIVSLFAAAALVHALVLSVWRGRRQLGVLKSIGFTRAQVMASVAWHATLLAVAALVVGLPLGVVVARLVWRSIVSGLGLRSPPALPVAAMVAVAVLAVLVANLAAAGPGWVAGRTRPATTLRTE